MFQKDSLILPLVILALLLAILFLIFGPRGELPELVVESKRDAVFVSKTGDQPRPLPFPEQTPVAIGERVQVQNIGWATLHFQDGVTAEILRQGQLVRQSVEPGSELLKFIQDVGTVFNDFNAEKTVIQRLEVAHEFNQSEFGLGEIRIVSTTAYGTKFIVAREDNAPLLWVVALDAAQNDLTMTVADGSQTKPPFPITTSSARWVAPIGEPSPPISVPLSQIEQWLNELRDGQLQTAEIGDVIWQPANDKIDGEDFRSVARLILQRGAAVQMPVQGGVQGTIELTLDPGSQSGNPVVDVPLEDCNTDGLFDMPIRNNETIAISFLPTTARVRNFEVEIYNRSGPFSASLQMFDPARRPIGPAVGSTVGQGLTETLKAAIAPAQGVYHYADLKMFDGCLLALTLIPPPPPPTPISPTDTPTPSPTPLTPPTFTPMPVSTDTPTPIPTGTPAPVVTPTEISQCPIPPGWVQYIAQVGDTWGSLSERVSTSVYDLQQANCRNDQLQSGQSIYLPFAPPTPTIVVPGPSPTSTRTPTPTPVTPFIIACSPSFLQVSNQFGPTPTPVGQRIDFTCDGGGLRPNESGFRAELRGPNGQNIFQFLGGTSTTIRGTIPAAPPQGQYELTVINPDGRSFPKSPALIVREAPNPFPQCFRATPNTGLNDREAQIVVEGRDFRPNENGFRVQLIASGEVFANLPLTDPRSSTSFTTIVPAGLPAGLYNVEVTNPDGSRCSVPYLVDAPGPIITDFYPKSGDVTTEVLLTVIGANFRPEEAGFLVALRSQQSGQTIRLILVEQGFTQTNFQAIIAANTLALGFYDLIVTNPDGKFDVKGVYEARTIPLLTVSFDRTEYPVDEPLESGRASVDLVLSASSNQTVTVWLSIEGGTAQNGTDYLFPPPEAPTNFAAPVIFTPDVTRISVPIWIYSDRLDEPDETINFVLSNPQNATLGTPFRATLKILDNDDPQPTATFTTVSFSSEAYRVREDFPGSAIITVTLSAFSSDGAKVYYATNDRPEGAKADLDYIAVSGILTFASNQRVLTFTVPIINDDIPEGDETIGLSLSDPVTATLGISQSARLTIFQLN